MTSVERVVEYTELESEAPWETDKHPSPDWPRCGCITFDRVNFSYSADGPVVLKNMTAVFRSREKVSAVTTVNMLWCVHVHYCAQPMT